VRGGRRRYSRGVRRLVERFASGDQSRSASGDQSRSGSGYQSRSASGDHRPGQGARAPAVHRDLAALTPRELEVLTLMGRGLSNTELAHELILSEATVKTHVARIFAKLALRDRAQAVVLAYETGLVSPGEPDV
jgi:DNA-binding NarL/FixJ family response regulator